MKAVVRYAKERGCVELRDVPVPKIGKGDVLLHVRAAGLCGSDVNHYKGLIDFSGPVIIGHEFAGEIAEVGEEVTAWHVGDRVVSDNNGYVCGRCYACIKGEYLQCPNRKGLGFMLDGGFAEYVRIDEAILRTQPSCLLRIPDSISFDEASILDPICNAYNAAVQQGRFMMGESVAVFGAGPLSLGGIAVASIGGASRVICIVRSTTSELHRKTALAMGATHILDSDSDGVFDEVMRLTDGEGVELVLDGAGANSLFPLSVAITQKGGRIARIGYDWGKLDCSLNALVDRNISLIGHAGYNPVSWRHIMKLLAVGKVDLKPTISHTLPLEDFDKGLELMMKREAVKVVFHP